jgi:hypothetical protein
MRPEDKKYIWWGLLGIGVAALFYFLSSQKKSQDVQTVTVPYLVPQSTTGASPTASTGLSNQPNIIGSSPNSTIQNFANPLSVATSPMEAPNTWGFMPVLNTTPPTGVANQVAFGGFNVPQNGQPFTMAVPLANSPAHA